MSNAGKLLRRLDRDGTLTDRAEAQLENLIVRSKLQPGDQLPSQDDLAETLSVSRTVVREAIFKLAAKGLLESRPGEGVYVKAIAFDLMNEPVRLLMKAGLVDRNALMEAREPIEVEIAGLAALRATDEQVAELGRQADIMKDQKLEPQQFAEADLGFHNALARAAQSPMLLAMAYSINDVMINVHLLASNLYGMPKATAGAYHHHRRILDTVRRHDQEAARQAMRDHMALSRQVLEEYESTGSRLSGILASASVAGRIKGRK